MSTNPDRHDDASGGWTREEQIRYARHISLPGVGTAGQQRLRTSRVLVVGAGGLGSPVSLYLAAAGVGTLGLVDFDTVELSNLQRQIVHGMGSLGRSKTESAATRITDLNPEVTVETFDQRLTSDNAIRVLSGFDVIIDGSDNFPTRYLLNDACVIMGKPYVYGAIFRFEGQASVFGMQGGPCYRCLYAEPPPPDLIPSCAEGGVLGVLPGVIGSIQALEAIKYLLGLGDSLSGRLLLFDGLALKTRELAVRKDPQCPVCGERPTITELIDYQAFCGGAMPGGNQMEISVQDLHERMERQLPVQVVDVRERHEWEICRLPGARLIPLSELAGRAQELDSGLPVVTYCHTGVRSLHAAHYLAASGYDVVSLIGGVDAWATDIDPAMARY